MKDLIYHRCVIPAANRYAAKTAVIDGDYRATYSEHMDRVLRLASGMKSELGLDKGDRFAVLSLNSHYFMELYHAGYLGGTMINPLNLRLAPLELEYILKDSGTEVVFVDWAFAHVVERVREAAGIKKVVLMGSADVPHNLTQDDLIGVGSATVPDEPEEDDPAILMYTGGTTGLPKGVVMDNRASMLNLYKIAGMIKIDDSQVCLHQVPMFHVAGMLGVFMLGPGARGEVCARAGNFMREYWHRPEQTDAAFAGGWYHSGDAGYLDDNGYLFLVDRVKDMIVSGGENVYSAEVENAIAAYPDVAQVAVIGIPSEKWGEAVHAIVVMAPGATATDDEIKAWCKDRIAGYKVPKSVEFRTEALPLSGALKVLKKDLRAPYWERHDRSVS